MKRIVKMIYKGFESSCSKTPEFKQFCRFFSNDMRKILKGKIRSIQFSYGHFYISGFFQNLSGQIYYFSISDVRYFKDSDLLIRTATSFTDYTGGYNQYIDLINFETEVQKYLY